MSRQPSPARMPEQRHAGPARAFTLIELLVVMVIMSIMASALMAVLGIAQRQARIANTRSIMMKVDQAIRLFRNDMKVYPWQTDLSGADSDPAKLGNNLAFRLAWKPADDSERTAYDQHFQADLRAIHAKFVYRTGQQIGLPGGDGSHAFRTPNIANEPYTTNILMEPSSLRVATPQQDDPTRAFIATRLDGYVMTRGLVLSRLADEVTSLRYIAGQLDVTAGGAAAVLTAPQGIDPALPADKAAHPEEDGRYADWYYKPDWPNVWHHGYHYVPYNKPGALGDDSRGPVLDGASIPDPVASPGVHPVQGFRADYLSDAFHRRADAGDRGEIDPTGNAILDAWGNPLVYVCAVSPGAKGYAHACDNGGGRIDERRYGLGPQGRDATSSLHSDIRSTAAAAYVLEFELWSAGQDGRIETGRDAAVNRDNVGVVAYAKGLE